MYEHRVAGIRPVDGRLDRVPTLEVDGHRAGACRQGEELEDEDGERGDPADEGILSAATRDGGA
ncbi:MAG TPA: hypothetical protein VKB17_09905 [Thermoleophilaceae bacterium]|nr:hypothetical protein [Thermoleophilaceae bacterium]